MKLVIVGIVVLLVAGLGSQLWFLSLPVLLLMLIAKVTKNNKINAIFDKVKINGLKQKYPKAFVICCVLMVIGYFAQFAPESSTTGSFNMGSNSTNDASEDKYFKVQKGMTKSEVGRILGYGQFIESFANTTKYKYKYTKEQDIYVTFNSNNVVIQKTTGATEQAKFDGYKNYIDSK